MTHQVPGTLWESAVVVRVPELDETVAALRKRFDLPRKPNGIPPHITALVPFLPAAELRSDAVLTELRAVCAGCAPFEVTFARTARFPRVLYLAPDPAEPFIALTRALTRHWPDAQPYAGEHKAVVPHLTVTTSQPARVFDAVAEALEPLLPVTAPVQRAQAYLFDGRRWSEHAWLEFGAGSSVMHTNRPEDLR